MRALWYLLAYLVPVTAAVGVGLGGWWLLVTPLFIFALTPLMDEWIGLDERNPEGDEEAARAANPLYDWIARVWVPVQIAVLVAGLWVVGQGVGVIEAAGLVLALGMMGGIGINVAHELCHRKKPLDRALAEALLTSVSYAHFAVEHVFGHHKHVATPLDPASARLGETVYGFVPRSVIGGWRSFWAIEGEIAARKGHGRLDLRNRRLRYPLVWGLSLVAVTLLFGWVALAVYVAQGIVAFAMLEVINYLEHYGLERRETRPGRYERVAPHHSWNSAHRLSGWYLFGLPRHSDHHYLASRPYPVLRHHPDAPQLPAGYATMFVIALVPPLWRAMMDPRVAAWRGGPGEGGERGAGGHQGGAIERGA